MSTSVRCNPVRVGSAAAPGTASVTAPGTGSAATLFARSAAPRAPLPARRQLLAGLAGVAGMTLLPGCHSVSSRSGSAADLGGIVDVHHHLMPPTVTAAQQRLGPPVEPPSLRWRPEHSIADMDAAGVALSMLSITTPGVNFTTGDLMVRLARDNNEYAARLIGEHPGRFGSFAALPLPDIDASLREIEYAMDTLHAEGIGLLTSYDNRWLGHASFAPVLQELDRRKAVVYTHPTAANCCRNLLMPELNDSAIEFGTDTTRTIASLLFSGAAIRYPNIHWIFSHAGGTMPFLNERLVRAPQVNPRLAERVPQGALAALRRFHYDIAQAAHPAALAALTQIIPTSQIVFGTDFPYRTAADHVKGLVNFGFSADALHAIGHANMQALLPQLKART